VQDRLETKKTIFFGSEWQEYVYCSQLITKVHAYTKLLHTCSMRGKKCIGMYHVQATAPEKKASVTGNRTLGAKRTSVNSWLRLA
jgi:hypothetical protein